MTSNEALVTRFYEAFQKQDGETMAACYHPDVHFSDPVFTDLRGDRARDMWRMLCGRAKDLRVEFRDVNADEGLGSAHWEAWYTFSTGRKVHNVIDASFVFSDGLIVRHADTFDLKAWAGQALGPMGRVFGGMSFMQKKIRAGAISGLDAYQSRKA